MSIDYLRFLEKNPDAFLLASIDNMLTCKHNKGQSKFSLFGRPPCRTKLRIKSHR